MGWSSSISPLIIVIGISANFLGATIDFARRRAKYRFGGFAELGGFSTKLFLPRGCMGECNQVTRPLIQFSQIGSRFGFLHILTNFREDMLQATFTVNFTIDMSIVCHE